MRGLRVLALLSGGKDSVAAVDCARQAGWDVVAALTIVPAHDDAWMFHTPNLPVVRGVAQCLGLPLIEAASRPDPQHEVEDLEAAIRCASAAFRLDGIVSGALASEYQRTRIDGIGHRLGLRTFAPLWHKDPASYLAPMLDWDIRFARCAAEGVPNAWAGERLTADRVAHMAAHKARPHVAGEGGEYETVVLDAPCYARRLVATSARVEATASRATWTVEAWHTEPKG